MTFHPELNMGQKDAKLTEEASVVSERFSASLAGIGDVSCKKNDWVASSTEVAHAAKSKKSPQV